jgi:lipid-binding SYLF domain-containing protein
MSLNTVRAAAAISVLALAAPALPGTASAKDPASEEQQLVNDARSTFRHFRDDPKLASFREQEKAALGFLIVPKAVRASFFLGGSGGRAVLVAKDDAGRWSGPSFYTVGTVSAGLQAGVDVSEMVVFVMTRRAMDSLLSSSVRLGVDASVAAGPVGVGTGRAARTDADFIYYTRSAGLFAGVSLASAMLRIDDASNRAYYRQSVTPSDILVRGSYRNPLARPLLETVEESVRRS